MSLPSVKHQTPNIGSFEIPSDRDKSDVIFEQWGSIKEGILEELKNDNINILSSVNCNASIETGLLMNFTTYPY